MTQAAICPKCGGRGEVQNDDRQFKVCDACKGWGAQMNEDVISPYACDKCKDTGGKEIPETAHESAGRVTCDCAAGPRVQAKINESNRVDAAFEKMFSNERQRQKAERHAMHYEAGPTAFAESMKSSVVRPVGNAYCENISDIVDIDACRRDINPNGVHVLVCDRLVALETEDLSVTFEEQMKYDLPPQVTTLTCFEAEVMAQLMMNELSPDGSVNKDTVHYWLDVFDFMGPDYFQSLKKLVAKLEWLV